MGSKYDIVSLNYVSLYFKDHQAAIEFYTRIFGEPQLNHNGGAIIGWELGNTWLTVFHAKEGTDPSRNPCNAEFAIHVGSDVEVDRLYNDLMAADCSSVWMPEDTEMYEPMRFAAVDDPLGVRIDIYCPHPKDQSTDQSA